MRSIAVVNQKGGSGKSTTTAALASALRGRGRFVGLLDLDAQGCLALLSKGVEQVDPGGLGTALRRAAAMDYVIIDTPPTMGAAVKAASDLADGLLIPTRATFLDLRGLGNLLEEIDKAKIIGLVVIAYRGHVTHEKRVMGKIEGLGFPVLATVPFSIAAADAGLAGEDLTSYRPAKARGLSVAYQTLAEGVERWSRKIG
jgi:cellulose biosynthesis protein BcsQ